MILQSLYFTSWLICAAYDWNAFTLTDLTPSLCLLSNSLSPYRFTCICIPVKYAISILFSNCTRVGHSIWALSWSIIHLHHCPSPITSHDCKMNPSISMLFTSLSTVQSSWCMGAAALGWTLHSHDAMHKNTKSLVPETSLQMQTTWCHQAVQQLLQPLGLTTLSYTCLDSDNSSLRFKLGFWFSNCHTYSSTRPVIDFSRSHCPSHIRRIFYGFTAISTLSL